jgi:hypothetical protein
MCCSPDIFSMGCYFLLNLYDIEGWTFFYNLAESGAVVRSMFEINIGACHHWGCGFDSRSNPLTLSSQLNIYSLTGSEDSAIESQYRHSTGNARLLARPCYGLILLRYSDLLYNRNWIAKDNCFVVWVKVKVAKASLRPQIVIKQVIDTFILKRTFQSEMRWVSCETCERK